VIINTPWRLSFFKPAYGEIFEKELEGYDYWGYCDLDLMWGNIMLFIDDAIERGYERIGTKGHSSLYKNSHEVNIRYKTIAPNTYNYVDVFSGKINFSFDEDCMDAIYDFLGISYCDCLIFAHLEKFESSFYITRLPKEQLHTNKYQVFVWSDGELTRHYIDGDKLRTQQFMYIHFFCRPMKYYYSNSNERRFIIFPDVVKPYLGEVSIHEVMKYGKQSLVLFYIKMLYENRRKLNLPRLTSNLKNLYKYFLKRSLLSKERIY